MLLGHMGGPFWARKESGAWSIPKGGLEQGEAPQDAAVREFGEETGLAAPEPPYQDLGISRQRSGKIVHVLAVEADLDLDGFTPGMFDMEWPPRSGRMRSIPELDRIRWVAPADAATLLVGGQRVFVSRLQTALA